MLGVLLIALIANGIAGPLGPRDLADLRRHRADLEARRAVLIADNAALREKVQQLRSDNRYIETMIRRELGYARAGELVYKFTSRSTNSGR